MDQQTKERIVEKVYDWLMSQSFEDWQETIFMDHVCAEEGCQSREEIKETISRKLFKD